MGTFDEVGFNTTKCMLQRMRDDITCIPVWNTFSDLFSMYAIQTVNLNSYSENSRETDMMDDVKCFNSLI